MTTRHHADSILIVAALAVLAFCLLAELVMPHPHPLPTSPAPVQIVAGTYEPIAIYRERDRTLLVATHAGRDLLVCLGDEKPEHCKLVEDWRSR